MPYIVLVNRTTTGAGTDCDIVAGTTEMAIWALMNDIRTNVHCMD